MFVQGLPGHPVGMPFPGGDKVEVIDGIYYCPVREKANDVDAALCPFCPALQTPEIGYLKPPVNASKNRKQEFIRADDGITISTGEPCRPGPRRARILDRLDRAARESHNL